ncbi:hypothetical protein FOZ61_007481 [Perkinsus olseni]|uniref:Uncharacterized protein n=1 Tax=Perkinsus olseni TaxID=32597 RepID=A0A7J6L8T3_PEROL|nr:hypothetical protein FOZ61_007481 [Perkinsus olseni]
MDWNDVTYNRLVVAFLLVVVAVSCLAVVGGEQEVRGFYASDHTGPIKSFDFNPDRSTVILSLGPDTDETMEAPYTQYKDLVTISLSNKHLGTLKELASHKVDDDTFTRLSVVSNVNSIIITYKDGEVTLYSGS